MKRRAFLLGSAGLPRAQSQVPDPQVSYPEEQHPKTKRGQAIAEIARSLRIQRGIAYSRSPQRELTLDVYSPRGNPVRARPAILTLALAAWFKNRIDFRYDLDALGPTTTPNMYPPVFVPRGFIVIAAEVRTSSEAKFPAPLQDCRAAIRWVRANASKLGVDPRRIALLGPSASGHLCSLAALTADGSDSDTRVSAVCSLSGLYDFELYGKDPGDSTLFPRIEQFLGAIHANARQIYRKASPARFVHSGAPSFLLTHGLQDRRVPYSQMPHFEKLLRAKGVDVETIAINHYQHGALPGQQPTPGYEEQDKKIFTFFDRVQS